MNMTIMSYQQQQNDYSGGTGPHQGASNPHHGLGSSSNKLLVSSATIASSSDDTIKSQFQTREGTYKLMTLSEFSRPSRVPLNPHQGQNVACNAPVRVSFVNLPEPYNSSISRDYICFNVGRELYVYAYCGVSKEVTDLSRPIDKRVYKGTFPTCHDFNRFGASGDSCPLLIGFSAGQIQLIDPFKKEGQQMSKLFNEERLTDKTRITCVRWIPSSSNQFLVSHSSGFMYVYNEELNSAISVPVYQLFKQGDGFVVHTCKTKSSRNPVYRWSIGEGSVNEFAFSSDGALLATAGQDGFLRIFNYHAMECVGLMRSYFGGLLCLAWSPDMRYVATGGEDDLISVYSVVEKRIVCRCQGHKSWVSQVAFDPYTTLGHCASDSHLDSEEDLRSLNISSSGGPDFVGPSASSPFPFYRQQRFGGSSLRGASVPAQRRAHKESINSLASASMLTAPCSSYRLGSVGHDTMLCLWDLTEDILKPLSTGRLRTSALFLHSPLSSSTNVNIPSTSKSSKNDENISSAATGSSKESGLKLKRHFMNFRGLGGAQKDAAANISSTATGGVGGHHHNPSKMRNSPTSAVNSPQSLAPQNVAFSSNNVNSKCLGTPLCPHLNDTPIVEPLINKKISHERLTVLIFREDCVVTACQEGFICTWARPGRLGVQINHSHSVNSPNPGGSPRVSSAGTVV